MAKSRQRKAAVLASDVESSEDELGTAATNKGKGMVKKPATKTPTASSRGKTTAGGKRAISVVEEEAEEESSSSVGQVGKKRKVLLSESSLLIKLKAAEKHAKLLEDELARVKEEREKAIDDYQTRWENSKAIADERADKSKALVAEYQKQITDQQAVLNRYQSDKEKGMDVWLEQVQLFGIDPALHRSVVAELEALKQEKSSSGEMNKLRRIEKEQKEEIQKLQSQLRIADEHHSQEVHHLRLELDAEVQQHKLTQQKLQTAKPQVLPSQSAAPLMTSSVYENLTGLSILSVKDENFEGDNWTVHECLLSDSSGHHSFNFQLRFRSRLDDWGFIPKIDERRDTKLLRLLEDQPNLKEPMFFSTTQLPRFWKMVWNTVNKKGK